MNKEKITKAVSALNEFMHNWCINEEETERKNDLTFRCSKCEFSDGGYCRLKRFKNKYLPDFEEFGAMGDL